MYVFRTGDRALNLIYHNAISEAVRYFRCNPELESMILGISGGIDSAVTAALASKAIEELKREGRTVKLYGYILPIISNKESEMELARQVGEAFCAEFTEYDMGNAFDRLLHSIDGTLTPKDHKVRIGNIKARLRMIYLYDKANKYKGLVLSTDNYTEYLLGFWTLHGDVGDFGFIQNLWKTEVYALAEWMFKKGIGGMTLAACTQAVPTDGLGVTNSDMDQLFPDWQKYVKGGFTDNAARTAYRIVDKCLIQHITGQPVPGETTVHTIGEVVMRYEDTHFKRENPVNIPRERLT